MVLALASCNKQSDKRSSEALTAQVSEWAEMAAVNNPYWEQTNKVGEIVDYIMPLIERIALDDEWKELMQDRIVPSGYDGDWSEYADVDLYSEQQMNIINQIMQVAKDENPMSKQFYERMAAINRGYRPFAGTRAKRDVLVKCGHGVECRVHGAALWYG